MPKAKQNCTFLNRPQSLKTVLLGNDGLHFGTKIKSLMYSKRVAVATEWFSDRLLPLGPQLPYL